MDKKDAMEAEMIDDINIATSETSNDVSTINRYSDSKFRIFSIDKIYSRSRKFSR